MRQAAAFGALERAVGCYDDEGQDDDDIARAKRDLENVRKLLAAVQAEVDKQNCICKFNPWVGNPVPCSTCEMRSLLRACRAETNHHAA